MNGVINRPGNTRLLGFVHKVFKWLWTDSDFLDRNARIFAGDVKLGDAVRVANNFTFVALARFGVELDALEANSAGFKSQDPARSEFVFNEV